MKNLKVFTPEQFGAKPLNPEVDDTDAIQCAVHAAETVGGTVEFGPHTYDISATILQKKACRVIGCGWGDVLDEAWPTNSSSRIRATAPMQAVWKIQAKDPDETIFNPIIERICLDGNFRADIGLWSRSTAGQIIGDIHIRLCKKQGMLIDDGNGKVSKFGLIRSYRYNASSNAAAADSNGLEMESVGPSNGGLTNWNVGELNVRSGINGEGLIVGDCDSSYFGRVQGSSIRLRGNENRDPEGLRASRKNTFSHIAADVYAESGSITTVHSINSEPTRRIILEPDAIFQYDNLINRQTGANYQTRRFTMNRPTVLGVRDSTLSRPGSQAVNPNPDIVHKGSFQVETLRLPPQDDTKRALWSFSPPDDYDDGAYTGIMFRYFSDPAVTTPVVLNVYYRTTSEGQFAGAPEPNDGNENTPPVPEVVTILPVAQDEVYRMHYHELSVPLGYERHDITSITVERPSDIANTGNFDLVSIELQYASEGPIDNQNQQYDVPEKTMGDGYVPLPSEEI